MQIARRFLCAVRLALLFPICVFPALCNSGHSIVLLQPASPATFGAPLTLIANVTPADAAGTVTFYDGVTMLGFGILNSGQATLTTITLGPGTHKLRAYYPGPTYPAIASAAVTETVNAVGGGGFYAAVASPLSTGVGATPRSIAIGDFNRDGIADMAIVNQGDSTVSVLLGDGSGGFNASTGSPFAAGALRRAVAVGDFNGDGIPDLVVVGGGLGTVMVTILQGDGHGGFSPATGSPFPLVAVGPSSVAVADFNGDGKADLVIGCSNQVAVVAGNGDGSFQTPVSYLGGSYNGAFSSVAIGDFNGDGNADVAFTHGGSPGGVSILSGNGAGGFTTPASGQIAIGSAVPGSIPLAVAGDFNGDGNVDLAVADQAGSTVTVLLGNGANGFTAAPGSPFNTDSAPSSLVTGDFNGDGILDLALSETGGVEVQLGKGDGTFSQPFGSPYAAGTTPISIVAADLNGDGRADLASVNNGSNNLTLLLAYVPPAITLAAVSPNPSGFGQQLTLSAGVTPAAAAGYLTFFDGVTVLGSAPIAAGQAVLKSVALSPGQHSLHALYVGSGAYRGGTSNVVSETVNAVASGVFVPASLIPVSVGASPSAIASGDFNGDGRADLAITNSADNTVTVLLGNGGGGFTASTGSPFPAGTTPSGIAVGDFNGDGKSDLVVTDRVAGNSVTVLLGDGKGGFSAATGSPFASLNIAKAVAVADFDGDGIPDLVVGGAGARVMLGSGDGAFAVPGLPGPSGQITTTSVAVGDFNGDGSPDAVAVTANSASYVSLWEGSGAGFIGKLFPTGSLGPGVTVGDFSGDGKADLAFASSADGNVRIFIGDGNGNFALATGSPFPAGTSPSAMATGDFNGDGKADLAVANSGDGTVSIFLGDGKGGFSQMFGSPFQAGGAPIALTVADFNGDGRADLAVVNGSNSVTILLGQASAQTISFAALPNVAVTTAPFGLAATASSGLTVAFASTTPTVCTVSGSTVTILISGGCAIVASQAGGGAWLAAPSVTQKFTVLFADVDSSVPAPQIAAIDLFAQYGITAGCGNNDFCPAENVTRAQMAIFVVRSIFGGNTFPYSPTPHFADVGTSDFGFQYIQAMYELGITKGCSNVGGLVNYCPNDSITRLQMAVFIIRARLGSTATFSYPSGAYFSDVQPLSVDPTDINFGYVQRMRLEGITSGCSGTGYCPNDPVTRAQMAVFVMRALFNQELVANTPVITQISPATLARGASNTFTVTGLNTNFAQGTTTLAPIPGVTIGTITVNSTTSMTVQLTADANAVVQPRTMDAITGSQEAILPNGLSVQ